VPKGLSVGSTALPDASSTTTGATFALAPPSGHLNLVFFGYTNCPDVCPGTMRTASSAIGLLGGRAADVSIAMVSVDPRRDTAARMKTWVSTLVAGGHGHGLRTDDKAALAAIEERLAIVAQPYEKNDFEYIEHTGGLFAVAPGGAVVAEWPYGIEPSTLAADITKLLTGRSVKAA
jgi:protein SCO1/2